MTFLWMPYGVSKPVIVRSVFTKDIINSNVFVRYIFNRVVCTGLAFHGASVISGVEHSHLSATML